MNITFVTSEIQTSKTFISYKKRKAKKEKAI